VNDDGLPHDYVEAGKTLASPDVFNCFSCHQRGDIKPEGPPEGWAPTWRWRATGLNPDWILAWYAIRRALMPGTKMPSFHTSTTIRRTVRKTSSAATRRSRSKRSATTS
jgi:mono/diheme cytochrome c family protein